MRLGVKVLLVVTTAIFVSSANAQEGTVGDGTVGTVIPSGTHGATPQWTREGTIENSLMRIAVALEKIATERTEKKK